MDSLAPIDDGTAHVRDLLSRLGAEPAPPDVVGRLAERLGRELPAPPPRRRLAPHGYRRAVLGAAVPLAIGVAIAFAVISQNESGDRARDTFGAISTAPTLADEDAASSAAAEAAPTSSAAASGAATAAGTAAAAPLSSAAAAPAPAATAGARQATAPPVSVPSVVDRYPADAVAALRKHGLRVRFAAAPAIEQAGPGVNGYAVAGQDPAAGAPVEPGATVVLRLAPSVNGGPSRGLSGHARVRVPAVVGLEANAALRRLTDAGLLVTIRGSTGPLPNLAIAAQDVRAGAVVRSGTVVTLSLGR